MSDLIVDQISGLSLAPTRFSHFLGASIYSTSLWASLHWVYSSPSTALIFKIIILWYIAQNTRFVIRGISGVGPIYQRFYIRSLWFGVTNSFLSWAFCIFGGKASRTRNLYHLSPQVAYECWILPPTEDKAVFTIWLKPEVIPPTRACCVLSLFL